MAAEVGDLELLQLLVSRGALLDLRDTAGSTPLHLALEAQVGGGRRSWRWSFGCGDNGGRQAAHVGGGRCSLGCGAHAVLCGR